MGLNSAMVCIIHDVYDFLINGFRSIQVNRETYGQIECTVVFLTLQQCNHQNDGTQYEEKSNLILAEETSFSTRKANWLSTLSTAVLTIFGTYTKRRKEEEKEGGW